MLSCVRFFMTPWTVPRQVPLSMGILQVRILEWVAISFSRGCFPPRDQTHISKVSCISVQFSRSVVSNSLQPHGPRHTRPPCPSPTPGVYPNSCPLSRRCHPAILPSVVPFSSCPQSFPASGSFQMSQLCASGGQVLEFQLQHQSFQ